MKKKIIVAGGGHGGIAAAAILAEQGYDVTVYEKNERKNMGYDWTDNFDPKAFVAAGIEMPPADKYKYKDDMTFYGPGEHRGIKQRVPQDELEINMERHDIYDVIITHAENAGVKFEYSCNVLSPLTCGDRVVGIKTDKGDFYGDMVIDSCGCNSPVRANLPDCCGIQKQPGPYEKFYTYRAFFNRANDDEVKDKYKAYLMPEGILGVSWVATEDTYTDVLIGRFEPFDLQEAERTIQYYRSSNPSLGTEMLRGGKFSEIPVRHALSVMVADGYAAIGDSAFMTMPIIGSGIANSLKAARMLADVIISDKDGIYSAETLWKYQLDYFKALGGGLAPLAQIKLLLTKITPRQVDYLIDNGILTWREMIFTANSTSLWKQVHLASDMPKRGLDIVKDPGLTKLLLGVVKDISATTAAVAAIPRHYGRYEVQKWAREYDKLFAV